MTTKTIALVQTQAETGGAQEVARQLAQGFEQRGYRVRQAAGGHEARRLIAAERPALVVSDLRMPEGDGWALLDYCHLNVPDVPVILISGSDFGTYPQIESRAAAQIVKPFSPEQLLSEVERNLPRAPARMLSQTGRAA